ncbi:MAG: FIST C-terminal domain-containing protein [Gammaproteobacteria bacterium]|nr:FIST C-terminal domain-containing protein [Gammaproteobacteria bacterium]
MEYRYLDQNDENAINALLQEWSSKHPQGGALVYVAERDKDSISRVQQAAKANNFPVVGGVFPEVIVDGVMNNTGALYMLLPKMPTNSLISIPEQADATEIAALITEKFPIDENSDTNSVLMLFDGMIPNVASVIDALYLEWGDDVKYMGSNVGSETFQSIPCLFNNDRFIANAALMMLIPNSDGAIVEHNYRYMEKEMPATSTMGNRISTIDWRPAFEVYQELAAKQYNLEINKDNFYDFGVHYPFGIVKADGEALIRIPVGMDDDGALFCVGEVPENSMLTLMKAIPADSPDTTDSIQNQLSSRNADALMVFYCAGRRMHLGASSSQELTELRDKIAPVHVIGALSLGEIGGSKQDSYPLFHNATIAAVPCR